MTKNRKLTELTKILCDKNPKLTQSSFSLFVEELVPDLVSEGLIDNDQDQVSVNCWINTIFEIVQKYSSNAFVTQEQVFETLSISKPELIRVNRVIRESSFCQNLILEQGHASKYWLNTVIPLVSTGLLEKVSSNEYCYPHRVGLFCGLSCMFACTFCGREKVFNSRYKHPDMVKGNAMYEQIISQAPKHDPYRFYISGGLEPLTNAGVGDLITFATQNGFRMTMYTNGFALRPSMLDRQPGILELDTIRVSIYGTNQESTYGVTQHKDAYRVVKKNLIDYLSAKEKYKSETKIGINFVVLPGHETDLLELLDLIIEVNDCSSAKCGIDFVTLREDFSYSAESILKNSRLPHVFAKFQEKLSHPSLENLHIDYGYGLHSFSKGQSWGPVLHRVTAGEMRGKGFTQLSVSVDLLGSVYLYREAAFLNRPGSDRYIIGKVSENESLEEIISKFLDSDEKIVPRKDDTKFFDAYDHVLTSLINSIHDDREFGVAFGKGPVKFRAVDSRFEARVGNPSHFSSANLKTKEIT
jgi:dTDP-4-amino-4,6-dideoxy-D-glucose ammonia-lyase